MGTTRIAGHVSQLRTTILGYYPGYNRVNLLVAVHSMFTKGKRPSHMPHSASSSRDSPINCTHSSEATSVVGP